MALRRGFECEEPGCAEGPGIWPWSALVDAETWTLAMVGPWQYQCSVSSGGVGSTRYTTLPGTHPTHHPGYYPSPAPHPCTTVLVHGTDVLGSTKEILGVDYAPGTVSLGPSHAPLRTVPRSPSWSPPVGPCWSMRTGLAVSSGYQYPAVTSIQRLPVSSIQYPVSSISEYSVILSISQYFSVFQDTADYQSILSILYINKRQIGR